jgi:hypothetical protein
MNDELPSTLLGSVAASKMQRTLEYPTAFPSERRLLAEASRAID